jgi:hypothetical protein
MKTIIPIAVFLAGVLLTGCRKSDSSGLHGTAMSKMYQNDKLIYEFAYSKGRLIKEISYNEVTGLLDYYTTFEYDNNGNMVLQNQYTKTDKLSGQVIYTYGPGEKVDHQDYKSLSGADSGSVTTRIRYSYDAAGRANVQAWHDPMTDELYTTRELSYYDNNNLRSSEVYYYYSGRELQWKTEYSPEGEAIPADLVKFSAYPVNFLLYELVAGQQHFYQYDDDVVDMEINEIASNREYDNKGFLLKQTITRKQILPAGPDRIRQMKYEYVKL